MSRLTALLTLVPVAVLSGCNTGQIVPEPGKITLEEAMTSVGKGLANMKAAEGGIRTGLSPSEVTVTFNISASATDTGKLYVEVGAPTGSAITGKIGGEASTETKTSRGNQITIKFANLLFADENTLIQKKTGQEIKDLLKVLHEAGVDIYAVSE
jgi:hypothetical protein